MYMYMDVYFLSLRSVVQLTFWRTEVTSVEPVEQFKNSYTDKYKVDTHTDTNVVGFVKRFLYTQNFDTFIL